MKTVRVTETLWRIVVAIYDKAAYGTAVIFLSRTLVIYLVLPARADPTYI